MNPDKSDTPAVRGRPQFVRHTLRSACKQRDPPRPPLAKGGKGALCAFLPALACLIAATDLIAEDNATRVVVVTDAEGKVRTGALTELGAGQITLGTIEQVRLKTRSQVSLKIKDRTSTIAAVDPLVVIAGGDILAVRPESFDDESLTGRWARFQTWPSIKLPLETVRGVLLNRPPGAAAGARLVNILLDYREPQDAIILSNGDTLSGEFVGQDGKNLLLNTPLGKSAIDRGEVRAVIFNPTLTSGEAFSGEAALVSLIDGSRFRARDVKLGALDRLSMRTLFGVELEIPLAAVESLRFLGGCATYLSDLAYSDYKFEPFLDLVWPLRRDRSVSGGFLTLRGIEYPKGLGAHSQCAVSYRLDGKFRRFHTTIGIDDETAGKGSVVFEVLLDGKSAYQSNVLTGASPPVVLDRLDVSGVKTLTLRVDYATLGDIQDHADWCDALLIK
jgi:hypothetical protein